MKTCKKNCLVFGKMFHFVSLLAKKLHSNFRATSEECYLWHPKGIQFIPLTLKSLFTAAINMRF